jgi:hypothetical protein
MSFRERKLSTTENTEYSEKSKIDEISVDLPTGVSETETLYFRGEVSLRDTLRTRGLDAELAF